MFFDGIGIGFEKNLVSEKVSVSVSTNFGIEKSIGFGFEKFWYRKSIGIVKNLVSKKYRIRFHSDFGYFGLRFSFETSRFLNFSIFRWFRIRYRKN